jgi:hypothetical protein
MEPFWRASQSLTDGLHTFLSYLVIRPDVVYCILKWITLQEILLLSTAQHNNALAYRTTHQYRTFQLNLIK